MFVWVSRSLCVLMLFQVSITEEVLHSCLSSSASASERSEQDISHSLVGMGFSMSPPWTSLHTSATANLFAFAFLISVSLGSFGQASIAGGRGRLFDALMLQRPFNSA